MDNFKKSFGSRLDTDTAIELFNSFGIYAFVVNHYHMKLQAEEDTCLYEWYYTTGSLVRNFKGSLKKVATIIDPEAVAEFITKHQHRS